MSEDHDSYLDIFNSCFCNMGVPWPANVVPEIMEHILLENLGNCSSEQWGYNYLTDSVILLLFKINGTMCFSC
jgi:hypothetical protein